MKRLILISILLLFNILTSCKTAATATAVVTIDCCPNTYYYQNTSVIPEYTFANEIIIGENVIPFAPQGPVTNGNGQFKQFIGTLIEIQPGSELSTSEYLATGFCNASFALNNHPTINPIRIPNVFTPNGDGQNDNFMVNVNSATYVILEIYQQINGNMQRIYRKEQDINSNYTILWDGIQGVNSNSSSNQTQFFYDIVFMNCKDTDIHRTGWVARYL
jgi:hypothetical protein